MVIASGLVFATKKPRRFRVVSRPVFISKDVQSSSPVVAEVFFFDNSTVERDGLVKELKFRHEIELTLFLVTCGLLNI